MDIRLNPPSSEGESTSKIVSVENKDSILSSFLKSECADATINCFLTNSNMSYDIGSEPLYSLISLPSELDSLNNDFGIIIKEINPNLFIELKSCSANIFKSILDSASASKSIEIDLDEFRRAEEIGLWIHNQVLGMDNLTTLLQQLQILKENLDEFREKLMLTSYS